MLVCCGGLSFALVVFCLRDFLLRVCLLPWDWCDLWALVVIALTLVVCDFAFLLVLGGFWFRLRVVGCLLFGLWFGCCSFDCACWVRFVLIVLV